MINISTYFKSSEIWKIDRVSLKKNLRKKKTMTFKIIEITVISILMKKKIAWEWSSVASRQRLRHALLSCQFSHLILSFSLSFSLSLSLSSSTTLSLFLVKELFSSISYTVNACSSLFSHSLLSLSHLSLSSLFLESVWIITLQFKWLWDVKLTLYQRCCRLWLLSEREETHEPKDSWLV